LCVSLLKGVVSAQRTSGSTMKWSLEDLSQVI